MEEGGLNIKEILSWNKVFYFKYMWGICEKRDGNWRRWVEIYYLKRWVYMGCNIKRF